MDAQGENKASRRREYGYPGIVRNNRALSTMVEKLSSHYGKEAYNKELSFLTGGFNPPGYCQVTLEGTGLGLYFEKATGQPMGKLTGAL